MITDRIRVKETLVFDADANVHKTRDGYLVAQPRVARTGIQIYAGSEVGKPNMDRVRVYRPPEEVFHKDAMASLAHKPITNSHPREAVDAKNWKKYAAGNVGDEVARDGEYIRVPILVMDGGAIEDIANGKRELSLGYDANLEWRSGTTDAGEQYDAVQTGIRINHLAIVDAARGGNKLVIGDDTAPSTKVNDACITNAKKLIEAGKFDLVADGNFDFGGNGYDGLYHLVVTQDGLERHYPLGKDGRVYRKALERAVVQATANKDAVVVKAAEELVDLIADQQKRKKAMNDKTRTVTIDGIPLENIPDTAASVIERALKAADTARDTLQKQIDELKASAAKLQTDHAAHVAKSETEGKTKDAEIATLKKQVEDSKMTPQKLDQMVRDRSIVIGKSKLAIGDKLVVDGKTDAEIMKQVVDAKLGDTAKGWDDAQVKISFETLTKDMKVENGSVVGSTVDAMAHDFSRPGFAPASFLGDSSAADKARAKSEEKIRNAWKTPASGSAN